MDIEQDVRDGKTAKIVLSYQGELKKIQEEHPELRASVDSFASLVRERLLRLREQVDQFPDAERELVSFLVINGIHRMCDEVFLAD